MATVAGLLPTAYGFWDSFDSFISPIVIAMAWGLLVGAPAVLFIIPVLVLIGEDFHQCIAKFSQKN